MSILGQAPKPAEHGRFIQQQSLSGQKIDFISTSNTVASTLTLQATGNASDFDFGYFYNALQVTIDGILIPASRTVGWNYYDFFVDSVSELPVQSWRGTGGTLTRGQLNIEMNLQRPTTDTTSILNSSETYYFFKNNDSSIHTITGSFQWKYIITA